MVFRIALNFFGNTYDAEDAVQEVMLKLYTSGKSGKRFESEEHLRFWLIRVTVNFCKNELRSARRRKHVAFEDLAEPVMFEYRGESELYGAVMSLPEAYRSALYLFYYEELSVKEIATLLKLSETAVTTRLSRARSQLKLILTTEAK